jgi:hypothetical protein
MTGDRTKRRACRVKVTTAFSWRTCTVMSRKDRRRALVRIVARR